MSLNPKQLRFCQEYIIDLNATKAAERAGYAQKTAYSQGQRLLKHVEVSGKIAELQVEVAEELKLSARDVLEQARRLAFADIRGYYRPDGTLKPLSELTPEQAAAVAGFEVIVKNAEAGDGHTDTVHKYKLVDKWRPTEGLMKHFGLLTEKVEHSGAVVFTWRENE